MLTLAEWLGIAGGLFVLFGIYFKNLQRKLAKQHAELLITKDKAEAQGARLKLDYLQAEVKHAEDEVMDLVDKYRSPDDFDDAG